MNKVRYIERKYLCKYDLTEDFFKNINLEVLEVTPLRKLFIIDSVTGKKILKRVQYGQDKINFTCESLNYINKGFPNTVKYNVLNHNKNYVEWNGDLYILMDVIRGREVAFTNEVEVQLCSQTVGNYHKSGVGIKKYFEESGRKVELKNIPNRYKEALKELEEIYLRVKGYTYLNEFDKVFLDNYDFIKKDIYTSIEWCEKELNYDELVNNESLITLCHNDLAHHNFVIDEGIVYLLDFDYCSIDLRVVDVADFLTKSIKNAAYDIDKGIKVLNSYNDVIKLENEELNLLYGMLRFPKELYTIVKDYYYKRKDWDEEGFISKLNYKVSNEVFRREFCEEYKNIYL